MDPATDAGTALPGVAAAGAAGAAGAAPRRWAKLGDNPLQTVLGAAVVGLLVFALTGNRSRIDRLEDTVVAGFAQVDDRFAAQDAKIDANFAVLDAKIATLDRKLTAQIAALDDKIAALDDKIAALDRKLTALIAALNATAEVDAALEGRLLDPDSADAGAKPGQ